MRICVGSTCRGIHVVLEGKRSSRGVERRSIVDKKRRFAGDCKRHENITDEEWTGRLELKCVVVVAECLY